MHRPTCATSVTSFRLSEDTIAALNGLLDIVGLPRRDYNSNGDRCSTGPRLRNTLQHQLRQPEISFIRFKTSLKMASFGAALCD